MFKHDHTMRSDLIYSFVWKGILTKNFLMNIYWLLWFWLYVFEFAQTMINIHILCFSVLLMRLYFIFWINSSKIRESTWLHKFFFFFLIKKVLKAAKGLQLLYVWNKISTRFLFYFYTCAIRSEFVNLNIKIISYIFRV